jgi:hypothetical protein
MQFRAQARCNRMLGQWAAEQLGKSGPQADAYADELVRTDINAASAEVFRKIRADFDAAGVPQTDHQIRRRMEEFLTTALASLKTGS